MIKTRLTEFVGLKYPIIQAGMGPYPVTSLCIAAANTGCPGLCSTLGTTSRESSVSASPRHIRAMQSTRWPAPASARSA